VLARTAGQGTGAYSAGGTYRRDGMTITLHCLDCGFRFSLTLAQRDLAGAVAASLSCGQCGCRRWAAG
jgi:hypothetical protein